MMSLTELHAINQEVAAQAAQEGRVPLVLDGPDDLARLGSERFRIPNLGDHRPEGWRISETDVWFVDKSGWGRDNEPALTEAQFKEALGEFLRSREPGSVWGFAVTQEGPFQVFVNAFRKLT